MFVIWFGPGKESEWVDLNRVTALSFDQYVRNWSSWKIKALWPDEPHPEPRHRLEHLKHWLALRLGCRQGLPAGRISAQRQVCSHLFFIFLLHFCGRGHGFQKWEEHAGIILSSYVVTFAGLLMTFLFCHPEPERTQKEASRGLGRGFQGSSPSSSSFSFASWDLNCLPFEKVLWQKIWNSVTLKGVRKQRLQGTTKKITPLWRVRLLCPLQFSVFYSGEDDKWVWTKAE